MKILCLAAGFATRLWPLTRERAKALLDIAGKPVLTRILDRLLELDDLSELLVITNARFEEQFETWSREQRLDLPVRILSNGVREPENGRGANADLALGWAHAMRHGDAEEDVLVVAGDNLHAVHLRPHQATYRADPIPTVLCRALSPPLPAARYGEVVVDESSRVTGFREKPDDPRSPLAATSTYFFPATIRAELEAYLEAGGNPDAGGHFIAWLAERRPVRAGVLSGTFFDIGNFETLEAARRFFDA